MPAHAFEMELDGLADLGLHFFERSPVATQPGRSGTYAE